VDGSVRATQPRDDPETPVRELDTRPDPDEAALGAGQVQRGTDLHPIAHHDAAANRGGRDPPVLGYDALFRAGDGGSASSPIHVHPPQAG